MTTIGYFVFENDEFKILNIFGNNLPVNSPYMFEYNCPNLLVDCNNHVNRLWRIYDKDLIDKINENKQDQVIPYIPYINLKNKKIICMGDPCVLHAKTIRNETIDIPNNNNQIIKN